MFRTFIRMPHGLAGAALLLAACSEAEGADAAPELAYHYTTPHLEVHADIERCEGDLARLEGFIDQLEDTLAVEMPYDVDLYVWSNEDFDGLTLCGIDRSGCFRDSQRRIFSSVGVIEHELVHAITTGLGNRDAFFREGIAEALSGSTEFGLYPPVFPVPRSRNVDYRSAGHFVRWLLEAGGPEAMVDYLSIKNADVEDFRSVYSDLLSDDFTADFYADAKPGYPRVYEHAAPALQRDSEITWSSDLEFDCGHDDVRRTDEAMMVMRELTIPEPGFYAFWTSTGGEISIRERYASPSPTARFASPGIHARSLAAGTHEIGVTAPIGTQTGVLHVWLDENIVPTWPTGAEP